MEIRFDQDLNLLKGQIATMGGYVEKALDEVITALLNRQPERLARIQEYENAINQAHIQVDEKCLELLAIHSPRAKDLRLILAVIKINTDLERMGDQTMNISHNARHLFNEAPLLSEVDLPSMSREVRGMVRNALDAFMIQDLRLAKKVLDHDDIVDAMKNDIFKVLTAQMKKDNSIIERALDVILIARNMERLADHATNIAEDVIFVATGDDVRHGAGRTFKGTGSHEDK